MIKHRTALRIAAACLLFGATPALAGEPSCGTIANKPRLVCDEGACIRVPFKDLCDAVRASYPAKRPVKSNRIALDPIRDQLTLLIAQVS